MTEGPREAEDGEKPRRIGPRVTRSLKGKGPEGGDEGFSLDKDESLHLESSIQVVPYDLFLKGHGQLPGQQKESESQGPAPQAAAAPEAPPQPAAGEAGAEWAPLGLEGPEGASEGDAVPASPEAAPADAPVEAPEAAPAALRDHRFGLRLGSHGAGNLMGKLRARLKKNVEPVDMEAIRKQEFEEARAERIEPDERYKEVEVYPIKPPYGQIRILFDDEAKEYIYQPLEPILTKTEKEILHFIEETLVDTLTVAPDALDGVDERQFITDRFNDVIFDYSIILHESEEEEDEIKRRLLYYVLRDFIGFGHIDLVMEDPYIEDISCDGPHVPVFLYHRKYESVRSTVRYKEHEILDAFVIKMAQRSGKHISIAEPILDATLPDGSRLQATLSKEVSAGGSTFTIRKFRPDPFTPPDLVLFRTMSAEMLSYLWIAVQHGSSILYAGGTASGKTTSLNAILLFIPPQMKIVSIEDTREVNLPHENWIAGITRHGFGPRDQFGRQAGEIDMFQLLKNALRQRPEYIIVGEVRGQEAYSLFQAMATGHAAYGTMHADSVDAVIHRLESDPINVPRNLLEALDVVSVQIQTRVGGKRVRRTKQISEIVGIDPHTREILTNEVFRWVPKDDSFKFSGISYILERIQLEKALPEGSMVRELKRRAMIIEWMIRKKIQDYREVSKVVSAYYREPETVIAMVQGQIDMQELPSGLRVIAERKDDAAPVNPLSAAALEKAKVTLGAEPTPAEIEAAEAEEEREPQEEEPGLAPAPALAALEPATPAPGSAVAAPAAPARPVASRPLPDLASAPGWTAGEEAADASPPAEPPAPVDGGIWGGAAALLGAAARKAQKEAEAAAATPPEPVAAPAPDPEPLNQVAEPAAVEAFAEPEPEPAPPASPEPVAAPIPEPVVAVSPPEPEPAAPAPPEPVAAPIPEPVVAVSPPEPEPAAPAPPEPVAARVATRPEPREVPAPSARAPERPVRAERELSVEEKVDRILRGEMPSPAPRSGEDPESWLSRMEQETRDKHARDEEEKQARRKRRKMRLGKGGRS